MRVTLISPEWPGRDHSGGVARYAFRLAEALSDLVELTVITVEGNDADLRGATIVRVKRDSGRIGRYYKLPFRLRVEVAKSSPDVVHSFGDEWAIGHAWPMVRTFHGSSKAEAASSAGLRKWNHYVLSALEHWSARKADVRVGVGADSMREFSCDLAMPPVVPIERVSLPGRDRTPSVVFVGSFEGRKRGWIVAETVAKIREDTESDVGLHVVGPASDSDRWPSFVKHYNGLSDSAVRDLIARSWVLAAPSAYEGFGIPVFEAMALGTPAVTSPTPGATFLKSMLLGSEGLWLVDDVDFASILKSRVTGSCPDQSDMPSEQVQKVLELASIDGLVGQTYPLAIARFKQAKSSS